MIRVTGFYRWQEGASFNHEYYHGEHMRHANALLSPQGLVRLESDRFLSAKPPVVGEIVAASNAYFPTVEVAQAALAVASAALIADVANYTSLKPEIHFSVVTSHA